MLSIVVIEYHSLNEIGGFVKSSKAVLDSGHELIVSSNSLYPEDKQKEISNSNPNVRWIFNERNGGFAYGMNKGLRVAKGNVMIVMNPDAKFETPLASMIDFLQAHPHIGIIAPKIIDEGGIIQDSLRHWVTPWRFMLRNLDRILRRRKLKVTDYRNPKSVDWVIGAFMMFRRDFYEKVGGLSEDYFMYCEDMDWCKRAHLAGYDVVYYPEMIIKYKGTRAARKSWKYAIIFLESLFTYWGKYGIRATNKY